ncbi:transglycosylase family protein [Streptomyces sp. NRRL B-24484]|uniref:LysM peptidoglycan-binding domain-containing protein n=1 Tax=Streptomyces sp. NRRL B-24484 TaxID=1463833 RepID=UPI0004C2890F|nr:transglycosylase family protein [Streptomyces sp. NRRL B-24484]
MGFIGSGRHRRPTQTERAVAAAGVAGAGLAIPLLTATGAHAAPATTWDAVAQCASAGNWSKAVGNGEYGGLQLDLRTWVAYGGDKFASTPDRASKEEQITVAERVLEDRGAKAWGNCGTSAGLTGEGKPETVAQNAHGDQNAQGDQGSTAQTDRGASAPVFSGMQGLDASGVYWYLVDGQWYWTTSQEIYDYYTGPAAPPAHGQATAPGQSTAPGQATDAPTLPTAPGTTAPTLPGGTTTPAPGTTTAPGATAPVTTAPVTTPPVIDPITGLPVAPDQTTAPTTAPTTATTGENQSATATATDPAAPTAPATATPAPQQTTAPAAQPDTYTVTAGDTLSDISDKNKLGGWKQVYDGNEGTIGQDPNLIKPGQVLKIK